MEVPMYQYQPADLLKNNNNQVFFQTPGKDLKGSYWYTLAGGDQVYRLPTDNMPCVVPGNNLIYSMPVLRNNQLQAEPGKAGSMPNPGL